MLLFYVEVDVGREWDGASRVGDCKVGDGQCGARKGLTKGGREASSLVMPDKLMIASTSGLTLTCTTEGGKIVEVDDRGGMNNSVGTGICESLRL